MSEVQACAPVTYIVEPHPEGGWRLRGGRVGRNGLWYCEAKDAASYARLDAQGKACRVELRGADGSVRKVKEFPEEDVRGR